MESKLINALRQIKNETGTYYLDEAGRLVHHEFSYWEDWAPSIIHIPEGVTEIPDHVFRGYGIRDELVLPASLKRVGKFAFLAGVVKKVVLPEKADPRMIDQLAHALRFTYTWDDGNMVKDWSPEYAGIYRNKGEPRESWWQRSNESGTFYTDSVGILMDFQPDKSNIGPAHQGWTVLKHLHIPEGVTAIPEKMFQKHMILRKITFPKSLRCIGVGCGWGQAFESVRLPDVVFPENLETIGYYTFAFSLIQSFTIAGMSPYFCMPDGRQLIDTMVGEIRVAMKYKELLEVSDSEWAENFEITHPELGPLYGIRQRNGEAMKGDYVREVLRNVFEKIHNMDDS